MLDPDDPRVIEVATPTQLEYLRAAIEHGGCNAADRALGFKHDVVGARLRTLKRNLARTYPDEHVNQAPEGYILRGVSTLRKDAEGNNQWVKTQIDKRAQLETLKAALEEIIDPHRGRLSPLPCRTPQHQLDSDLLAVYPWADAHIGLYAWAEETKEQNFDLKIAESMNVATIDRLVSISPPARRALLLNLGDFLHAHDARNRTANDTPQDVDSRWGKVCRTAVRLQRWAIDRLLEKYQEVHVIIKSGNHDRDPLQLIATCFRELYSQEGRLTISDDPSPVEVYEHGECLIGACHGDRRIAQPRDLPGVLAAKWPELWGRTRHRLIYTGHTHKDITHDRPGCAIESVRSLAPESSWGSFLGIFGARDLKLDMWHKRDGRITRLIQGPLGEVT